MRVVGDKSNIRTNILVNNFAPTFIVSITQLQDGTILVEWR